MEINWEELSMLRFGLACFVPCLLLALLHWVPWRGMLKRELSRLEAYCIGVGVIWLTFAGLTLNFYAVLLGVVVISAGVGTAVPYLIDHIIQADVKRATAEGERDAIIQSQSD